MKLLSKYFLTGFVLLFSGISSAGITLGGTRVVYQEKLKETSIMVKNDGDKDIMVQSWIEPATNVSEQDVPFALTPALSRLGANKQQSLRIFYAGKGLPANKESVFWLNVQEIPQKSESDNTLQIAIRQRIKIFYRPTGLIGSEEAAKQLKWQLIRESGKAWLVASNSSPFYISFGEVYLKQSGKRYTVQAEMIGPGATLKFLVGSGDSLPSKERFGVEYKAINDYGAPIAYVGEGAAG
ncbi:fimbria/pilus periplasmic chaperone [Pseudomonas sp. PA-1-2A]|uniref:fimbrial biogenesis chaperone n=1 Tax=Pseudomonas TaxID=286 RepID=UPI001EF013A2|nr:MULTISPECIES: molecular chaperone [Pseudomonas]MCF5692535.1 fimbria/pilus periplasmic chaperone [Pseudomonas sp. PA-1-8C]MCF5786085.1 fimbria/pilus periplasmic chaperone [Pseudomonas sp. PA-1-6G]MCF5791754.1 fimbria/pilus periplasmic chaperone [Pseudomonas sp. PA-1-6B]MCF5797469.1 fimbria/pilus periplasmic chaperone [Pseudomonas sp. PA-1-5A]MCF5816978.1 fimbria/pilus periplasmic chaperone [Pseudomonas sp. PA-1-2A]